MNLEKIEQKPNSQKSESPEQSTHLLSKEEQASYFKFNKAEKINYVQTKLDLLKGLTNKTDVKLKESLLVILKSLKNPDQNQFDKNNDSKNPKNKPSEAQLDTSKQNLNQGQDTLKMSIKKQLELAKKESLQKTSTGVTINPKETPKNNPSTLKTSIALESSKSQNQLQAQTMLPQVDLRSQALKKFTAFCDNNQELFKQEPDNSQQIAKILKNIEKLHSQTATIKGKEKAKEEYVKTKNFEISLLEAELKARQA
jgi:hypothetical protein